MPTHPTDMQQLLDRAAIHDIHVRYFQALDRSDPAMLRECFTEDVIAHYDGRSALRPFGEPVRGADALVDSIITFKRQQSGAWKITTHFMGNLGFSRLYKDDAETEVYALAFLVVAQSPADQGVMRSLRYIDHLRRTSKGWQISERRHTLDWSCQVPTIFAVTMAGRMSDAPIRSA